MNEYGGTPRGRYNTGSFAAYTSLQDDPNRLQRLPSLTYNKSSTSLFSPPKRVRGISITEPESESHNIDDSLYIGIRRPMMKHSQSVLVERSEDRRISHAAEVLMTPQMRSQRLIGNSNPRYKWQRYYKTEEQLKQMTKTLRKYYERTNFLIAHYLYIDRLLDSSLPHALLQEYEQAAPNKTIHTIHETSNSHENGQVSSFMDQQNQTPDVPLATKIKRTPKNLYKFSDEQSPLLSARDEENPELQPEEFPEVPYEEEEDVDSGSRVVTIAIYVNLAANVLLLLGKIAVIVLTDSLSVLASLVDAALDFLSTAIVWATTFLIQRQDQYAYPIGRRRLEPVGVLVFSVIMITSFFQVGLECFNRLTSGNHDIVELSIPAIVIMVSTVLIKGFCYFWTRLVKNSSVQALARDALTDMVFNTFSIIFPLIGFYAKIWWLDALGGLLLSMYVIYNWSQSASEHIRNLSGAAATADERNILLYLTMRFAKSIKYIQAIQAYHAGDKLNVEVDIVLDEDITLKDSHDLSESLQYVLESVPNVDRAFVHTDYKRENLPSHMNQQGS